ncbi:hypothetical protein [Brevundimonas sp.]|uniref:hypothetical protein n=1 Tax=Brevundimonas sp. TaxID=1871086 RepID=UPI0028AFC781|nr:hypothetical protein [Brevundimonas sp.]
MMPLWLDAVERSWSLKLAWLCVPYIPITALAVSLHVDNDGSLLIAALPAIVVFGGAALPFLVGLLAQPARKARRRALSPLQRMQMPEESDATSLEETLGIARKPPVDTLPDWLQAAIAHLGAPLPRLLEPLITALGLLISVALIALAFLRDPFGLLTRWTGLTLPLDYWSAYGLMLTAALLFTLWRWLRQMHDHYVVEAKPTGRRPFPALRS